MIPLKFTVESDIGLKRTINEDRAAFFERSDALKLAVLADGMGGHNAGDIASEMAVNEIGQLFLKADGEQLTAGEDRLSWLQQSIEFINDKIYQYSLSHKDCSGMGTTFIVVIIDNQQALIGHIGDSRVYLFSAEKVEQITRDHSYVNVLVENGEISEEEALSHPQKNFILKALGTEATIEPDYYEIQCDTNDYLLICSDGLSNKLSVGEMAAIVTMPSPITDKGQKLVQLANDSGGEDNISLVLLSFHGEEV